MAIEINCPECQALLRLDDETAGRQARCPSCSAVFPVVVPSTPDSPAPTDQGSPNAPRPNISAPLASAPNASAANPYAPTYAEPQEQGPSDWSPRQIAPEEVFSKSWAVFKTQWLMACVVVVIVGAINFGMSMVSNLVLQGMAAAGNNDQFLFFGVQFLMTFGTTIVQIWLQIGQLMIMLDIARGREVVISKLFAGGSVLVNSLLAVIMLWLVVAGIVILLVGLPAAAVGLATQDGAAVGITAIVAGVIASVPAVIAFLMFSQFQLLIIDRGVGAVESLQTSRQITDGNKLTIFLIFILIAAIGMGAMIVGLLALCVGVIPAMIGYSAFATLTVVVMYLCMTGQYVAVPGPSMVYGEPDSPTIAEG